MAKRHKSYCTNIGVLEIMSSNWLISAFFLLLAEARLLP